MKAPLITVYITNHNYGRYVEQAIESVLQQTFKDFELLIIDDGSTDNSREIIERYRDRPDVFIIHQQNKGLNVTNNIALRMARGAYIMRLDADDYLDAHALAVMAGVLEDNPEVGLVFPDYFHVDELGHVIEVVHRNNVDDVTLMDMPAHGACTMIRTDRLEEIGGYDESFRCQDGYDLWIRFIHKNAVKNVNLPLFYYRQHSESLTRNESRILETRSRIIRKHLDREQTPMRCVGVVPVRGALVNPTSPAMTPLAGKPLVEWTLDVALAAERLEKVIFTTPDPDLLEHVQRVYGEAVHAVLRDASYAAFNTTIVDTARHALADYAGDAPLPEALALLYIECPFRTPQMVDDAVNMLQLFETDSVVGVRPERSVIYRHEGCGMTPLRRSHSLRLEREDLYRDSGRLLTCRTALLEQERRVLGDRVGHVIIDQDAAVSLHSQWDWEIAEFIAQRRLKA